MLMIDGGDGTGERGKGEKVCDIEMIFLYTIDAGMF